jgi:hypothetical protein
MDTKTTGDWIMYYEVQRLQREGVSYRAIAKTLGTVFLLNSSNTIEL